MSYRRANPNTGKVPKIVWQLSDGRLEAKPAKAEPCFQTWKCKSHAELPFGGVEHSVDGPKPDHMDVKGFVNKKRVRTARNSGLTKKVIS